MSSWFDLAVVGAGISGVSLAHRAAAAGLETVVFEQEAVAGGCIHTVRDQDFWYELGAHTLYNSYGSTLELIDHAGLREQLQPRTKAPFRLLVDGQLRAIPSELRAWPLLSLPWKLLSLRKRGLTVREYYGGLVGELNFRRVVAPLLSAVPSQVADEFPAEMLFKSRRRLKSAPRTFTLPSGLSTLIERLLTHSKIQLRLDTSVRSLSRRGDGFLLTATDGTTALARRLGLATPPEAAARLLESLLPDSSQILRGLRGVSVVSTGAAIENSASPLPRVAAVVPVDDVFFSVVSRDVVPDEHFRGFAFHFRPGIPYAQRLQRMAAITGVPAEGFHRISEHTCHLPSPRLGHAELVRALDASLAKAPIYLTGNYFGGLSIEDCVLRSRAESERMLSS